MNKFYLHYTYFATIDNSPFADNINSSSDAMSLELISKSSSKP